MSDERYVDPNSGAAPQPGGFAAAPVLPDGEFDAAVADEVTDAQEAEEEEARKGKAKHAARKDAPRSRRRASKEA